MDKNGNELCSDFSRQVLQQFQELKDLALAISGREIEILQLLDMLDRLLQERDDALSKLARIESELGQKTDENAKLHADLQLTKAMLVDARAEIETILSEKKLLELNNAEMARKLELVSELLKNDATLLSADDRQKLTFLNDIPKQEFAGRRKSSRRRVRLRSKHSRNTSQSTLLDATRAEGGDESTYISYDDTNVSMLRNGKVYKRPKMDEVVKPPKELIFPSLLEEEVNTPVKRHRGSPKAVDVATPENNAAVSAKISVRRSLNRSASESNIHNVEQKAAVSTPKNYEVTPVSRTNSFKMLTPEFRKSWTNGAPINRRPHRYDNYRSLFGDRCEVCNGCIRIGGKAAYKCEDCNIRLHKSCYKNAPLPCVPRIPTPQTPGKHRPRLRDYCPTMRPMIPEIIIHCVVALEKDRLISEGIYRIPGDEATVARLLNDFKTQRVRPRLEIHDTETITQCIKKFLSELRDRIIPSTSWSEFCDAVGTGGIDVNEEALMKAVSELPIPNQDTLAFLCAHFQRVCSNSTRNKTTTDVMARCIAPSIIAPNPLAAGRLASADTAKRVRIMQALLRLPSRYWNSLTKPEKCLPLLTNFDARPAAEKTPSLRGETPLRSVNYKAPSNINCSTLGPLDTPPSRRHAVQPTPILKKKVFDDI